MRSVLGMAGLLIVLLTGYLIYSSQVRHVTDDKPVVQPINYAAVRSDLLSLGQAERLFWAANGSYATLEQLRQSAIMGSLPGGSRSGYEYSIEVDGSAHFRITATPTDPARTDLPTLWIDETMQISQ
ncbi:MAG: type IV pilin protein [Acidobacteria bacterium]|nr:type IV pilin protein [Acidobacteriota bacterium]